MPFLISIGYQHDSGIVTNEGSHEDTGWKQHGRLTHGENAAGIHSRCCAAACRFGKEG